MYTVVGAVKSRAFRVMWMLEELGEDYTVIPAGPRSDEAKKYNPLGKVPALVDGADLIAPYATSTAEAIDILIKRNVSMIVLTDTGNLPPETTEAVSAWVNEGGTLLRFASPRLAASDERLLPMPLSSRVGDSAGSVVREG